MSEAFVTVARFTYSSEAKIVQGRLESDGISTFLVDALTIDTDPLVSNAIGGVKIRVGVEDQERATQILQQIHPYSLTNKGATIICPDCKSTKIDFFSHVNSLGSFLALLVGFFLGSLPSYTKYDYRCSDCKTKFKLDE